MKGTKIRKYHVWLSGNRKGIATDDLHLAEKKAILGDGSVYEDIRYDGRKRLQRMYLRAANNGILPTEIDYPCLLTPKPH